MSMNHDEFATLLTKSQGQIYGFIGRLVIDRTDADDVLQETNMALWKMADQFTPGTEFVSWACRVAYFRILQHRSSAKRFRIRLADKMLEVLAAVSLDNNRLECLVDAEQYEMKRLALASCLQELSDRNRAVLQDYYERGLSLGDIGLSIGRNANAVAQIIHRLRSILRTCIQQKLEAQEFASRELAETKG